MDDAFIYALVDPRTALVRYIGMSARGMRRPRQHRWPSQLKLRSHKSSWITSLARAGLDYQIVVLEACAASELASREQWWIAWARATRWPLTNATDGGDGVLNPSDEVREKLRRASTGRRHTTAAKATMSRLATGRRQSDEHRAAIGAAGQGRKHTAATKRKIRNAKSGATFSVEHRAKLSAAASARWSRDVRQ